MKQEQNKLESSQTQQFDDTYAENLRDAISAEVREQEELKEVQVFVQCPACKPHEAHRVPLHVPKDSDIRSGDVIDKWELRKLDPSLANTYHEYSLHRIPGGYGRCKF